MRELRSSTVAARDKAVESEPPAQKKRGKGAAKSETSTKPKPETKKEPKPETKTESKTTGKSRKNRGRISAASGSKSPEPVADETSVKVEKATKEKEAINEKPTTKQKTKEKPGEEKSNGAAVEIPEGKKSPRKRK